MNTKVIAFEKIQSLCKDYNIKMVLCFSPNFYPVNKHFEKRIRDLSNNETKFFMYDSTNFIYKNRDYFYDESHLITNGAKIYTNEICEFLVKEIGID